MSRLPELLSLQQTQLQRLAMPTLLVPRDFLLRRPHQASRTENDPLSPPPAASNHNATTIADAIPLTSGDALLLTGGGGKGGASHLTSALQLAESVVKRFRRDRRPVSAVDLDLLRQLAAHYAELAGEGAGATIASSKPIHIPTSSNKQPPTVAASSPTTLPSILKPLPHTATITADLTATATTTAAAAAGPLDVPTDANSAAAAPLRPAAELTPTSSTILPPVNGTAASRIRTGGGSTALMSKMREIVSAPKLFSNLVSAKTDMSSLTQFAVKCSSASLSLVALCELLHSEMTTMASRPVHVWLRDGASYVDPVAKSVYHGRGGRNNNRGDGDADRTTTTPTDGAMSLAISTFENGNRLAVKPVVSNGVVAIPLAADQHMVGMFVIPNVESLESLGDNLAVVLAAAGVAALSLRTASQVEALMGENQRGMNLLATAENLAQDSLNERSLINTVMTRAVQSVDAETCIFFVVDEPKHQSATGDLTSGLTRKGSVRSSLKATATVVINDASRMSQGTTFRSVLSPDSAIADALAGLNENTDAETALAYHVLETGETLRINSADEMEAIVGESAPSAKWRAAISNKVMCVPIRHEGVTIAVAQLLNKLPKRIAGVDVPREFSDADEHTFLTFASLAAISIRNSRTSHNIVIEQRKTAAILRVVALLSDCDIRDVSGVCRQIMTGAQKLLNADRASLFLVDKEHNELYSTVAGGVGTGAIRFPMGRGIAGNVASTGMAENIEDAYADDRFNKDIDKQLGYRTRSMLTEPITVKDEVIAVAQLVNKLNEDGEVTVFTSEDQDIFRAFALFAGISLSNSYLLQFAVQAGQEAIELQSRISEDQVLSRNKSSQLSNLAKVHIPEAEIERVRHAAIPVEVCGDMTTREFNLWAIRESEPEHAKDIAAAVVVKLFQQTGYCEMFDVEEEVLVTFVLRCRMKYRNVPYHNFFHVVDAVQTIYTYLFVGNAKTLLTDLECFVLLVTALCHDLDHMGVNNSFHLKTDSPLGILSSASGNNSVLEVHHCNMAIEILQDPKANVFSGLSETDLPKAYRAMIDAILATDMARHGDLMGQFDALIKSETSFVASDESHHRLVMKMLVKAADISNVTKPFPISRLWAMSVTEEFYLQGDKEKAKGVQVLPQFDRASGTELAKGQIGFIQFVCKKYFQLLVTGPLAGLQWTVDQMESNFAEWQRLLSGATS